MEKISKKQFLTDIGKSESHFIYKRSIPFADRKNYDLFLNEEYDKMIAFMDYCIGYNEWLDNLGNDKINQIDARKVVTAGNNRVEFSNGSRLELYPKYSTCFSHTDKHGREYLIATHVTHKDSCYADDPTIQFLTYCIKH